MDNLKNKSPNHQKCKTIIKFLNHVKNNKNKTPFIDMSSQYRHHQLKKRNKIKVHNLHKIHRSTFPIKTITKNNHTNNNQLHNNSMIENRNKPKESFIDLSSEFFSCPHLGVNLSSNKNKHQKEKSVSIDSCKYSYRKFSPKITSTPIIKLKNVDTKFDSNDKDFNTEKISSLRNEIFLNKSNENINYSHDRFDTFNDGIKEKEKTNRNNNIIKSKFTNNNSEFITEDNHLNFNENYEKEFLFSKIDTSIVTNIGGNSSSFYSAPEPDLMNFDWTTKFDSNNNNNYKNKDFEKTKFYSFENNKNSNYGFSKSLDETLYFNNNYNEKRYSEQNHQFLSAFNKNHQTQNISLITNNHNVINSFNITKTNSFITEDFSKKYFSNRQKSNYSYEMESLFKNNDTINVEENNKEKFMENRQFHNKKVKMYFFYF